MTFVAPSSEEFLVTSRFRYRISRTTGGSQIIGFPVDGQKRAVYANGGSADPDEVLVRKLALFLMGHRMDEEAGRILAKL